MYKLTIALLFVLLFPMIAHAQLGPPPAPPGQIVIYVYTDENNNGFYDNEDRPVPDVILEIDYHALDGAAQWIVLRTDPNGTGVLHDFPAGFFRYHAQNACMVGSFNTDSSSYAIALLYHASCVTYLPIVTN